MSTNYALGDIFSIKLTKFGGSYYVLFSPEIMEYLGIDPENDLLALKFEKGKWGTFIGLGKKRI